jgi:uncharacterized Zn-binding protein involved in type VI secretion
MSEAARKGDKHQCPCPTPMAHTGGALFFASSNVETNGLSAARVTDMLMCDAVGLANFVVTGSPSVEINGMMAARKADFTMHPGPGMISEGSSNVEIGGGTAGGALGYPDSAGARCAAMAAGRTSGSPAQSYNNCGIEASRQLINQVGGNVTEDELFDSALELGLAVRKTRRRWWLRKQFHRWASGGTYDHWRNDLLNLNRVPSHMEPLTMQNVAQAVAGGHGAITAHDAGILWADPRSLGGGHAIVTTGLEYDENGNLLNVIVNDTGLGQCRQSIPAGQYEASLFAGHDINVTNNPIW